MNVFVRKMLESTDRMYRSWMERKSVDFRCSENVEIISDIPYLEDGNRCHLMDIYRPTGVEGPLPVIIDLHGGGLVLCSKEVNRPFCAELARRGFLVFCVDYPLIPQTDVCGILRDVCAALDKVGELVENYGGDPQRIYLSGDSAGAFLGVYAVAAAREPLVALAAGVKPSRTEIRAMALISGMFYTNLSDSTGICLRKDFYGKNPRQHPLWPWLSPDRPEIAGVMPPCWLVTSKADQLRFQTLRFCRGLKTAGIEHLLTDIPFHPRYGHDFMIMNPSDPKVSELMDGMCRFLASA